MKFISLTDKELATIDKEAKKKIQLYNRVINQMKDFGYADLSTSIYNKIGSLLLENNPDFKINKGEMYELRFK